MNDISATASNLKADNTQANDRAGGGLAQGMTSLPGQQNVSLGDEPVKVEPVRQDPVDPSGGRQFGPKDPGRNQGRAAVQQGPAPGQQPANQQADGEEDTAQALRQVQTQTTQPVAGADKERVEAGPAPIRPEYAPYRESREQGEFEPEVEGWLEKVEQGHEIKLPEPVTHDGEVLVQDSGTAISDDMIFLPMTHTQVERGKRKSVSSGARWLAEWCMRLIKMFGNQVQYKQSQPDQ